MGGSDGSYEPSGSYGTTFVSHSPPRSGSKPLKACQDSACPYASSAGVVEDRSVLMCLPRVPEGHVEQLLFSTLLPEVALKPSKPIKTTPVLMPP